MDYSKKRKVDSMTYGASHKYTPWLLINIKPEIYHCIGEYLRLVEFLALLEAFPYLKNILPPNKADHVAIMMNALCRQLSQISIPPEMETPLPGDEIKMAENLIGQLIEYNAVLAGGFMARTLLDMDYTTDIDIFAPNHTAEDLLKPFWNRGYDAGMYYFFGYPVSATSDGRPYCFNGYAEAPNTTCMHYGGVDVICMKYGYTMPGTTDPHEYICQTFDLDFCKVSFDGKRIRVYSWESLIKKESLMAVFHCEECEKRLRDVDCTIARTEKYTNRGFTITGKTGRYLKMKCDDHKENTMFKQMHRNHKW